MKNKNFICAIILLLISSCASTPTKREFIVKVDAISSNETPGKSYIILPASRLVKTGDLQFKEYQLQVEKILKNNSLHPAKSKRDAQIVIFLYYSNIPEERSYSYSTPIYSSGGFSGFYPYGSYIGGGPYNFYSMGGYYNPSYISSYSTEVGTYVHYTKSLILSAVKNTKKLDEEVWRVTAESGSGTDDLREIFPILAIAAQDYVGKNSDKKVTVKIAEDDARINEIKASSRK